MTLLKNFVVSVGIFCLTLFVGSLVLASAQCARQPGAILVLAAPPAVVACVERAYP